MVIFFLNERNFLQDALKVTIFRRFKYNNILIFTVLKDTIGGYNVVKGAKPRSWKSGANDGYTCYIKANKLLSNTFTKKCAIQERNVFRCSIYKLKDK